VNPYWYRITANCYFTNVRKISKSVNQSVNYYFITLPSSNTTAVGLNSILIFEPDLTKSAIL
jgi:hypothetical protein